MRSDRWTICVCVYIHVYMFLFFIITISVKLNQNCILWNTASVLSDQHLAIVITDQLWGSLFILSSNDLPELPDGWCFIITEYEVCCRQANNFPCPERQTYPMRSKTDQPWREWYVFYHLLHPRWGKVRVGSIQITLSCNNTTYRQNYTTSM